MLFCSWLQHIELSFNMSTLVLSFQVSPSPVVAAADTSVTNAKTIPALLSIITAMQTLASYTTATFN